jgi:GNAT superfamily N-acetyltransferase
MRRVSLATECEIRPYRQEDEPEVLDLLGRALGGGPTGSRQPGSFRWKHFENPFGPSYMLVAEQDGRIVGLRAFMRWRFRSREGSVRAVRAVDTATHPDHRGRGIFSRLTSEAVAGISGDSELIFNTPNEQSLPGYLKMGWRPVGTVPVSIRVRRPWRFLAGVASVGSPEAGSSPRPSIEAEHALEALSDPALATLLDAADMDADGRLRTPRDATYLRWRYGLAPMLDYRAVRLHQGDALAGLAMFRVHPRGRLQEGVVCELIVRPGDGETARYLLGRVVRAGNVDHLACHFAPGSTAARAVRRAGFLRTPRGMTFIVNPIGESSAARHADEIDAWALTLGDLEVF